MSKWLLITAMVVNFTFCGFMRTAAAQGDSFVDSVYSAEGIEIRADVRVFTTMCLMASMGWRTSVRKGPPPTERPLLHPLRTQLFESVRPPAPQLHQKLHSFFLAHPDSVQRYVLAGIAYDPMEVTQSKAVWPNWIDLFQQYLTQHSIVYVATRFQPAYQRALKERLKLVDGWTKKLLAYLRLPTEALNDPLGAAPPRTIVNIVNEVGPYGHQWRFEVGKVSYVVTGPDNPPKPTATATAFMANSLWPHLEGRVQNWKELQERYNAVCKGRTDAVGMHDLKSYVAENLARAIVLRAFGHTSQQLATHKEDGYVLVEDFVAKLQEFEKGQGTFLAQLETWWPAEKCEKPSLKNGGAK